MNSSSDSLLGLAGYGILFLVIIFFAIGIYLAVTIPYILTLRNTLREVSPQNRKMDPGMTWILLIPVAGTIYQIFVVRFISESLAAEYRMRGMATDAKPTYGIGMAFAILLLCNWAINLGGTLLLAFSMRAFGSVLNLAILVCWIVYWVQVSQNKRRLIESRGMSSGSQIF